MSYFAVDDNRMPKLFRILCCFVLLLVILLVLGFILAKFVVFEDPHASEIINSSGNGSVDTETLPVRKETIPVREQLMYLSTSEHTTAYQKYKSKPTASTSSVKPGEIRSPIHFNGGVNPCCIFSLLNSNFLKYMKIDPFTTVMF